ncbi:MAG: right-handed parallel beta-helix repeat-containing protein, partial [Planctomycetota bacterium]|nr:right-handed parallel beta-helix repeat-containing protein [Planctomycetota bacterium]
MTLIFLALVLHAPLSTEPPTKAFHHGRTVRVPEDHHSIAEALASSQPNDRILIGPGTYYESLELPNHDVMLASTDGPEVTMIDGGSNSLHALPQPSLLSSSVIRMGPYAGRVELQGLTIQHGWSNEGGGLRVAGGVMTAKDCHFKRCNSIFGGAVCVLGGRVELQHCTLDDCGATFGGGVAAITGNVCLVNTTIERCVAQASGGGTWCDNSGTLNATDCTWRHCHASQAGGLGIQGRVCLEK